MNRQVALVTGASRGIGLGAARALARAGFDVALNDREESKALDDAADALKSEGVRAIKAVSDVADLACHDEMLAHVEMQLGPLTTLVNNAGVGAAQRGDPLDVKPDSWDRCFDINAKALFFLGQSFARCLLSRARNAELFHCMINITSSNAVAVALSRAEYCASKAAASMASKVLAVRLGPEDIAVYDLQPGLIDTDMTRDVIAGYRTRAADGLCLLPRVGQPEDLGQVIATLASGKMPYTTGQTISVDGGMLVPRF